MQNDSELCDCEVLLATHPCRKADATGILHNNSNQRIPFLCLQMSLVAIAADYSVREKRLQDVQNFCSPQLVSFISMCPQTCVRLSQTVNLTKI